MPVDGIVSPTDQLQARARPRVTERNGIEEQRAGRMAAGMASRRRPDTFPERRLGGVFAQAAFPRDTDELRHASSASSVSGLGL